MARGRQIDRARRLLVSGIEGTTVTEDGVKMFGKDLNDADAIKVRDWLNSLYGSTTTATPRVRKPRTEKPTEFVPE